MIIELLCSCSYGPFHGKLLDNLSTQHTLRWCTLLYMMHKRQQSFQTGICTVTRLRRRFQPLTLCKVAATELNAARKSGPMSEENLCRIQCNQCSNFGCMHMLLTYSHPNLWSAFLESSLIPPSDQEVRSRALPMSNKDDGNITREPDSS